MILGTADRVRIVTSSVADINVVAEYTDNTATNRKLTKYGGVLLFFFFLLFLKYFINKQNKYIS